MNVAQELDKKIEKKQQDIAKQERDLDKEKAYLQALLDFRKTLPRDGVPAQITFTLRAGSDVAKVREVLQKEGKPLHIDELLRRLGKEVAKKSKVSLGGSLGTYVRERKIFSKTGPNIFGLLEFANEENNPPDDFGLVQMAEAHGRGNGSE